MTERERQKDVRSSRRADKRERSWRIERQFISKTGKKKCHFVRAFSGFCRFFPLMVKIQRIR
jgi:hypothetical protein